MEAEKYILRSLIILIIACSINKDYAQNNYSGLRFRQITTEDGLPANRTYQTVEDKFGFIWIASSKGLCRYDGHKFRVFKHNPYDTSSISSDNIRTVTVDSKGNIWAGTLMHGLCRYDYSNGKFIRYRHIQNDKNSLVNDMVLHIFEDSKGFLWVGTEHGLSRLNPDTGKFESYTNKPNDANSLGAGGVICIAEDADQRIWVTTWEGGLNLVVPEGGGRCSFRRFYACNQKHFWSLLLDSKKRFWVGSFDGGLMLMKADPQQPPMKLEPEFVQINKDKRNDPSSNIIFDIIEDKDGKLWMATALGINVFDPSTFDPASMSLGEMEKLKNTVEFTTFSYRYDAANTIPSNIVNGLAISSKGIIWASTNGGVAEFDPKHKAFHPIHLDKRLKDGIVIFTTVAEMPNGQLWFGTDREGIHILDTFSHRFIPVEKILPPRIIKLVGENIFNIYLQANRFLYVGSSKGIFRINITDFSAKTILDGVQYSQQNQGGILETKCIFEDDKHNIWIGTTYGLYRFHADENNFEVWRTNSSGNARLSHNIITGIVADDDGVLWVVSYKGLDRINMATNGEVLSFTNYSYNSSDPHSISGDRATSICTKNGKLYISTETGISQLAGDGKFITLGNNEIPVDYFVNSVIAGDGNELWGTTNAGIFRYDIEKKKFRFYDKLDGIHDNEFRTGAAFKTKSGNIIFCGRMGVTLFNEKEVEPNSSPEKILLTNFTVDNKLIENGQDPVMLKEIFLGYTQKNIGFEFSSLNFLRPRLSNYSYKLEGFDKDWISAGNQSVANYSNLPGGNYIFKVRGTNSHGTWEEEASLSIPVHIALPFWKTNWFYIICFIVFYLIILLITHLRTDAIKRRNKQLEDYNEHLNKQVEERKKVEKSLRKTNEELSRSNYDLEQFAYIASHDLQEPLRMVGNFVQLLNRRYHDKLDNNGREYISFAVEGVTRMSDLIHSLLKYSRVGRNDMEFSMANIDFIVKEKCKNLAQLIQDRNVEITTFNLSVDIMCENEQLGMVFQNLINNAIKFNKSEQPKLIISCMERINEWQFSVADNGIGIDPKFQEKIFEIFKRLHQRTEFEGHGIGLALCKRIITRHGGKIWFESMPGEGTTFHFTVSKSIENLQEALESSVANFGLAPKDEFAVNH